MKKDEARQRILAKWPVWIEANKVTNPTGDHGMLFFNFLQKEHPELLRFHARGDSWQDVHGFLLQARLVSD